jgi:O-antigen/teichoic acid export membrane protein
LFSGAMTQSLLPAFSQLQSDEHKERLADLFNRGIRMNLIWLTPALISLAVVAKPFLTIWAGEEFGREGVAPFYILLAGLFFQVAAYFPCTIIMAAGRTDVFAKLYWVELLPYILIVVTLTMLYGAPGAAAAWSIRAIGDALLLFILAKRINGVSVALKSIVSFTVLSPLFIIPLGMLILLGEPNLNLIVISLICNVLFLIGAWRLILSAEEKIWLKNRLNGYFAREA